MWKVSESGDDSILQAAWREAQSQPNNTNMIPRSCSDAQWVQYNMSNFIHKSSTAYIFKSRSPVCVAMTAAAGSNS